MSGVLDVNADTWKQEIEEYDALVVVDFWHERCPWCLRLNPVYAEAAQEYTKVKFTKLNVLANRENQQLAIKYGIMGTPTIVFFCEGKPVASVAGFQPKERLKQLVDDVIVTHRECIEQSTEFKPQTPWICDRPSPLFPLNTQCSVSNNITELPRAIDTFNFNTSLLYNLETLCVELILALTTEDVDLEFQNSVVRIVALGNLQEMNIADTTVGPMEIGKEYEMRYWIALELVKAGYARFHDDVSITLSSLSQIQWRETRLQTGRRISPLPPFFYPKLRRYLGELKQKAANDASFAELSAQASRLARDIVSCRLKKIVNLAPHSQAASILKLLTQEEQSLFKKMCATISEWESTILKIEGFK